jgi:mono/diheme cytochrome c family protein
MTRLALLLALAAPALASAESGLTVFHSKCTRCHGADGAGMAVFNTPNFLRSKLTAEEMAQVIANGRAKMPSFKAQLSAEEIKAVAEYIKGGLQAKK